jgi:hypothetical protein
LARERDALFTFLGHNDVQATNWRAEHAIRPAVVRRKAWGGNLTWSGAQNWQVLASTLASTHLQRRDPVALLVPLLRAPGPVLAGLVIPGAARAREPSAAHPAEGALPGDRHRPGLPSTARRTSRAVDGRCVVRPGPTARPWNPWSGSGTGRGAGRSPPYGG